MGDDRKGDVRIYLISAFFLACTIGGGIFLCLYIILPYSESSPWYLVVGMTLVAIPWMCWLLIYLYRCFTPLCVQFDDHHHNHGHGKKGTPKFAPTTAVTSNPFDAKSPEHSPVDGERHNQFGAVVEIGNNGFGEGDGGQEHHYDEVGEKLLHHESKGEQHEIPSLVMVESRKSEKPFTY